MFNHKSDIDECSLDQDNCDINADCFDIDGGFGCNCRMGYSGTGKECTGKLVNDTNNMMTMCNVLCSRGYTEIDECQDGVCSPNAFCINTIGSFVCTCIEGFTGDGFSCLGRCLLHSYLTNFNFHNSQSVYACLCKTYIIVIGIIPVRYNNYFPYYCYSNM